MISVTRLYCDILTESDRIRYEADSPTLQGGHGGRGDRPIVVWNSTQACNLKCTHCYASACADPAPDELTTAEARTMIDDLAAMGAPVLLFSGGEPLMRKDMFDLGAYARDKGMRITISSNGTLIDAPTAKRIKDTGFVYVGISIDGEPRTHDKFRGVKGAFEQALTGIKHCQDAGVKVGLRFTMTNDNYKEILPFVFDFIVENNIPRCCFYHLVYAGRGSKLIEHDIPKPEKRELLLGIFRKTRELAEAGRVLEMLTVDLQADGPFIYLTLLEEGRTAEAEQVMQLLKRNRGSASGQRISCVDQHGNVHPDQFWRHYTFGNVRQRPFSEIWDDTSDPLMKGLKNKIAYIKGRCAKCRFLDVCGGGFRVRAEAMTGDPWAEEPACYLTDKEIGIE